MLRLIMVLFVSIMSFASGFAEKKESESHDDSKSVLVVVTNIAVMSNSDKATGYWMSEVSHAWSKFKDEGYDIDFASPDGGFAPIDPRSFDLEDKDNLRLWHDLETVQALATTQRTIDIDPLEYEAVYFAGGHGTMWDFPLDPGTHKIIRGVYESGGVVAAVCHGPAALINVQLTDGKFLVHTKKVTGFTNSEEDSVGLTSEVPFLLETALKERGAEVLKADDYDENVVIDGRLVTGQNPASASAAAEAIIDLLESQD